MFVFLPVLSFRIGSGFPFGPQLQWCCCFQVNQSTVFSPEELLFEERAHFSWTNHTKGTNRSFFLTHPLFHILTTFFFLRTSQFRYRQPCFLYYHNYIFYLIHVNIQNILFPILHRHAFSKWWKNGCHGPCSHGNRESFPRRETFVVWLMWPELFSCVIRKSVWMSLLLSPFPAHHFGMWFLCMGSVFLSSLALDLVTWYAWMIKWSVADYWDTFALPLFWLLCGEFS